EIYAGGRSEEILGRLVARERDQVVIATKYGLHLPGGNDPNAAGNQRKSLKRSIESSLRRLGTDYVDLLLTHCWDGITPVDAVVGGVAAEVAEVGRARQRGALMWLRAKPGVVPLLDARKHAQLQANLACLQFRLDPQVMSQLDGLSAVEAGYPHDYLTRTQPM